MPLLSLEPSSQLGLTIFDYGSKVLPDDLGIKGSRKLDCCTSSSKRQRVDPLDLPGRDRDLKPHSGDWSFASLTMSSLIGIETFPGFRRRARPRPGTAASSCLSKLDVEGGLERPAAESRPESVHPRLRGAGSVEHQRFEARADRGRLPFGQAVAVRCRDRRRLRCPAA